MKSIEIFLNFPVMDINMNVLWRNPERVDPRQAERLTRFWGDESWRQAGYSSQGMLFDMEQKQSNEEVAFAFRDRLKSVAGFRYVPDPMPMRNSTGAIVYYLFFASRNETGHEIVSDIFRKYREHGRQ